MSGKSVKKVVLIRLIVAVILLLPFRVLAWSAAGHRVVAGIAWTLLNPKVQAEINALLSNHSLISVATWADLVRPFRRDTATYHHVDIPVNLPIETARYDSVRDDHYGLSIVAALEKFKKVLSDSNSGKEERVEALKFLVHLVGDLHQPLHCASNKDAGGNKTRVTFFGEQVNLHRLWDYNLIKQTGFTEDHLSKQLAAELPKVDAKALASGTFADWARESYLDAREYAYALPSDRVLDLKYWDRCIPIVRRNLLKAAIRLARILNEALDSSSR